jgi:hypothetical protein
MRARAFLEFENKPDLDLILLDMSEGLLKRGRKEMDNADENALLINAYYTLYFLLRKLAHEVNRKSKNNDDRFIRVVAVNKNAPQILE